MYVDQCLRKPWVDFHTSLLSWIIDLDSDMCLMKHKSEAFEKFKEYKYEVEKETKHSIIILRLDRGGEYLNGEFLDYLKVNGIVSQWTPPDWYLKGEIELC